MSELKKAIDTLQAAASKGFEWEDVTGVLEKLIEEFEEVAEAIQSGDKPHIREEVGDVLFAAANLARFLKLDADECIAEATAKFQKRFGALEGDLQEQGRKVEGTELTELVDLWKKVKKTAI